MQKKDKAMKDFESYPDVAADIINALVYDGRQIVRPENLLSAPTETIYERRNSLRNQYEDVEKYELLDGKVNILYLIANQTSVDYGMLLRKAGYIGGAYREQYDGKLSDACPVMELVLYWGSSHWEEARSMKQKFRERVLEKKAWKYIDDIRLHVWECRCLEANVRKGFISDMRIVLDYLAEGSSYRSERKVVHKAALMNMIKVLSGDMDLDSTDSFMKERNISEEGEITVCELFDQYERRGRELGIEQTIRSFINKLHLTVEQALEAADIPKEEWSKYKEKLAEAATR